jgi:putative membrane protein
MNSTILPGNTKLRTISIFIIWLFHLSAIVGISMGFQEWFIPKTPLNLLIIAVLLVINFPITNKLTLTISVVFIVVSFFVEWVGVHFGFLFGSYRYGENLGIKFFGVPPLIGINWMVLIFCTAAIANKIAKQTFLKVVAGATLMVFIDFFIETSAPPFDFWIWELEAAPLRNYVSWFFVSLILHAVYHRFKIKGDFVFSFHLFAAQLAFFIYFYLWH